MLSVGLSASDFKSHISELEREDPKARSWEFTVACINSPSNITISGHRDHLEKLSHYLEDQNIFTRQLNVSVAYHSPQMNTVAPQYLQLLEKLERGDSVSDTLMVSSVTGDIISCEDVCRGEYWVQNMVSPVQFLKAMEVSCSRGHHEAVLKKLDGSHVREIITHTWVEVGPHSALRGPTRDILKAVGRHDQVTYNSALVRNRPGTSTFLDSLGKLYCQNVDVNLAKFFESNSASQEPPRVLHDLPQYPFDHSTLYWQESQSNKNVLFREYPKNDLLGMQVVDWNPEEAKWVFFIKASELPWIVDHKVNNSIIYPAAGMIAAAVEAIKLLVHDTAPVGFQVTNAEFINPLLLTTSAEGTETQISVSSSTIPNHKGGGQYCFRMFTRQPDTSWEEVCHGLIRADYGRSSSDVDSGKEVIAKSAALKSVFKDATSSCRSHVESDVMYQTFDRKVGIQYGPAFQVLEEVHYNDQGEAVANITFSREEEDEAWSHLIHPTTIDGLFQLVFAALTKGGSLQMQTMVPTRIGSMWISTTGDLLDRSSSDSLSLHTKSHSPSRRNALSDVTALDTSTGACVVEIKDFEITAISNRSNAETDRQEPKKICHYMSWAPELDLLDADAIKQHCIKASSGTDNEPERWFHDLELLLVSYSLRTLSAIRDSDIKVPNSSKRYVSWLEQRVEEYLAKVRLDHPGLTAEEARCRIDHESLLSRVCVNKRGKLHELVGERLQEMLLGSLDPLELLLGEHDHLSDFYEEMISESKAYEQLGRYLQLRAHKDPSLQVLEVGAGTGSATKRVLEAFSGVSPNLAYGQYAFSDISPAFLEKGREKFGAYERVDYCTLDIERDPSSQGFDEGQFDIIVASLVFHATKDLSTTLAHARKLLKPGGTLILMELTKPEDIKTGFIFGLLPGWWLGSEPERQQSPCLPVKAWNDAFLANGFAGKTLVFDDYRSKDCQMWNVLVSTATTDVIPSFDSQTLSLVLDKSNTNQMRLAQQIERTASQTSTTIEMFNLMEAASSPITRSRFFIILIEYAATLLFDIERQDFAALQKIFSTAQSILFITQTIGKGISVPQHGLLHGLSRVSRTENPKIALVTLALEAPKDPRSFTRGASLIFQALRSTMKGLASKSLEPEFVEIDGVLNTNRLLENAEPNEHIFQRTTQPIQVRGFQRPEALILQVANPGLLNSIEYVPDRSFEKALAPDQIEIEVHAIGVNFKDCLTVMGRVNMDELGSECSGIVVAVGSDCADFRLGDRVTVCDLGCYKTRVRVKEIQAVKLPSNMSLSEAAGIPTAFCTAYYSLIEVARLQSNESILIHAGSGGTGQAAIQVAQNIGAEVYTTVGSSAKKTLLMEYYHIPEDHIFYSRDTSFADGVLRMTAGRGVDVVLNSLAGDALSASWDCLAEFGRFAEIGRKDIDSRGLLSMSPFKGNRSFTGIYLGGVASHHPDMANRILKDILAKYETGEYRSLYPLHTFGLDEIQKAFRFLQSGKSSGKVIVEMKEGMSLPVCQWESCSILLRKKHISNFNTDQGCFFVQLQV